MDRTELVVFTLTEGTSTVVSAGGDIDLHSCGRFADEALSVAGSADRLVLDLSKVGFIDSAGIAELIRVRQAMTERGRRLHVVPSRRVHAALTLSALVSTLEVHDTVAAALAHADG